MAGSNKSTLRGRARAVWPTGYDYLVRLKGSPLVRRIEGAQNRAAILDACRAGTPLTVDIKSQMGFGGVLSNVVKIHSALKNSQSVPHVTSTQSLYAKHGTDMIGEYFIRNADTVYGDDSEVFSYRHDQDIPKLPEPMTLRLASELFNKHYTIRPEYTDIARGFLDSCGKSISVHYRGSDKRLEATAGSIDQFRDVIDRAIDAFSPDTLIVATDEPAFLQLMKERYGARAKDLEAKYMADGATPAHFCEGDNLEKGREALVTMLTISQTKLCVRSPSLLSGWAKVLNPELQTVTLGAMHQGHDHFPEQEIGAMQYSLPIASA